MRTLHIGMIGILTLIGGSLAGCQSTGTIYKQHTEMFPPIGAEVSVEIGETVIERTQGIGTPSIKLDDIEFEQSGYVFLLPGSLYQISLVSPEGRDTANGYGGIRSQNGEASITGSRYAISSGSLGTDCRLEVTGLNLADEKGSNIPNWIQSPDTTKPGISIGGRTLLSGSIMGGSSSLFTIAIPDDKCSKRYKFEDYGKAFRQELIYLGRSGDELSFKYREYSRTLARPAFSADLKYDLSESQTIGYRGARIQIIEAGNQILKYQVESHIKGI